MSHLLASLHVVVIVLLVLLAAPIGGCASGGTTEPGGGAEEDPVAAAIGDGVAFVLAAQRPDGGFPNQMCGDREMTECRGEKAVFPTALVIESLLAVEAPGAPPRGLAAALGRGLDHLEAQREPGSPLWRYWAAGDPMHGAVGPDLDDTAVVSDLLHRTGRGLPANRALIEAQRLSGGAFRTWPDVDEPPDCAVNLNVVAYLTDTGSQATGEACAWLREVARNGTWESCTPYYASGAAFPFFYARALDRSTECLAAGAAPLLDHLRRARPRAPFDLALHLSARSRLGDCGNGAAALAARLRRQQRRDGSWPAAAFFRGPGPSYFGSPVLTTAMAVRALEDWRLACGGR